MSPGPGEKEEQTPKVRTHTIYDKEWLRNVLNNICPQCEGVLEKKGILRKCTEQPHLYIYGNPVLVAYRKEKTIEYPPIRYDHCPECGSTVFREDPEKHEISCGNPECGIMLAGPYQYGISYPWHERYVGVE